MADGSIWFKCRGCGVPAGYYPDGLEANGVHVCPGGVTHSKPLADVGKRGVQCELFRRASCEEFWKMHEHDDPIEGPKLPRVIVSF